jgi:hypothetical protein
MASRADRFGNVYIAGGTGRSVQWALFEGAFVSKYDASGNLRWIGHLGPHLNGTSLGVSTDGFGDVYISGQIQGINEDPNTGAVDAFAHNVAFQGWQSLRVGCLA